MSEASQKPGVPQKPGPSKYVDFFLYASAAVTYPGFLEDFSKLGAKIYKIEE